MIISETLTKINLNSSRIAKLLKSINDEIAELSSAVIQLNRDRKADRISHLRAENKELQSQVEKYKQELIMIRKENNVPQIPIVSSSALDETPAVPEIKESFISAKSEKNSNPPKKEKQSKSGETSSKIEEAPANFGQLDIRIGKIVDVEKHPNADSLYVEKVDIGEETQKTIISSLVKHVPIEQMKNRIALFLLNLKPAKKRGITSEGMIMCASDGEKCEILSPPEGSVPGDVIIVEGYERKPELVLNPKKKIFETVSADFFVNEDKVATYKNIPWNVAGKGPAVSKTLINVKII